jgi:hypothetical protein
MRNAHLSALKYALQDKMPMAFQQSTIVHKHVAERSHPLL